MSRSIMRAQVLALLAVLLVASSAAQALAVSVLARTAPALAALQDEGDEEDTDQAQADEAESADEAQSEDGAEVEEAVSDEEEPAEEGEPAEEEEPVEEGEPAEEGESVDESEPAGATEPAAAAAEEPAASTPAPATGQPKADVERWSVTITAPWGVINLEVAIEKSSGAAVVTQILGDGVTGQSIPVEIAGDKLSWSWDVTFPLPMRFNCDSTIQGDQMSGNCVLGYFGKAPMFGSRK